MMKKGVRFTDPFSVEIGAEVPIERISGRGVVLYSGTKIYGAKTLIAEEVKIGFEAPATVVDCQLGPHTALKGGFFQSSVFLDKASMASGAHVREGSLLEEEAKAGHAVGLKQTLLFPFVTLGSLINFCDCLMAGGTGPEDHSEVGSSYVHFNYTPQQDKATPSLIGDVPRGVMLNQPPIFLGGQGGLVGPVRIDYGTVITAGTVWRRDSAGAKLLHGGESRALSHDYHAGSYGDVRRKVYNNVVYIANLLALRQWYLHVRKPFFLKQELGGELFHGAWECLEGMIAERLRRFRDLSEKMNKSIAVNKEKVGHDTDAVKRQRELKERWPEIEACIKVPQDEDIGGRNRAVVLKGLQMSMEAGKNYLEAVKGLDRDAMLQGTLWLQQIVDDITGKVMKKIPSFGSYVT
ncbi:MAG: UDP-N-acetylglucosamine pyrophosphorylase, partial [Syntrophales bacterium LBB04]|nr:UDP-N-acetylglucosamine pyrophosphorylase [Syntrophales bacterium LBB04]